jgi:CheY-like chemotaxis protein
MANADPWLVLVIDDDPDAARQAEEIVVRASSSNGGPVFDVCTKTSFEDGLRELERSRVDLVILDVRLGDDPAADDNAGLRTLRAIQERRFVPVVFYTAVPHIVRPLASPPLIDVVEKGAGSSSLTEAVMRAFESSLPLVNRALVRYVEEMQRSYMWDFVARHWGEIGASTDRGAVAYLLARRLAASLGGVGMERLEADLGGAGSPAPAGTVPPMRMYLMPPLEEILVGDVVHGMAGGRTGHWVVLSPSCDLVQDKAEFVLLAAAEPLTDLREVLAWRRGLPGPGTQRKNELSAVLRNNRAKGQAERYHFLPGALSLPDLLVDFQRLQTVERTSFDGLARIASLDSPYAEVITNRFLRHYSRLGARDVDITPTVERLRLMGPLAGEHTDG